MTVSAMSSLVFSFVNLISGSLILGLSIKIKSVTGDPWKRLALKLTLSHFPKCCSLKLL